MQNPPDYITKEFHVHKRTLTHWQEGGRSYFVTFRSDIGEFPDESRVIVRDRVLAGHKKKYELIFGVVMPDHVHLLIRPLEKLHGVWYKLAEIMKSIKGGSARRINIYFGNSLAG